MGSEDRVESFQSPFVVDVSFFCKEAEGCAERIVVAIDAGNVEERHVVFVGFICAIQKEGGVVAG